MRSRKEENLTHKSDLVRQVPQSFLAHSLFPTIRKFGIAGVCVAFSLGAASCGSGKSQIPGVPTFTVGVVNNNLIASFVASNLNIPVGASIPIPDLPGATASISPYLSTTGGSAVQGTLSSFDVNLTTLANSSATVEGLPDGRPLPDITGGELPRWSFQIGGLRVKQFMCIWLTKHSRSSSLSSLSQME